MPIDKRYFLEQLRRHFVEGRATTARAASEARDAAVHMATESEKKEDARAAIEFGSLAKAQALRGDKLRAEIEALDAFARRPLPSFDRKTKIGLGALVDLASEDDRDAAERTFMLLPVGAGVELTGPDGDGFLSVITPASPIGRALLGRCVGDTIDVLTRGEPREWTVTDVS